MSMLVCRCCPSNINIIFFKQLCHIIFKLRPIITLKYLLDWFQHKYNVAWFLSPKCPGDFTSRCNIDAFQDILARVPFKNIVRHVKKIKLMLLIRFCHIVVRMIYFLWRWYWTCQSAFFANHDLISFFNIDVILCSSFIALPPVKRRSGWQYAWYSFSLSAFI